ncbi:PIN domain-containing protein [Candidatus Gottesmanbacteria bacterium]|nr:PIN domain-containing protein [Candidatus Gottesmanbacteria bacterium]
MVFLDTNSLIRFFTNDIPIQAQKVKKIFDTEKVIIIPEVVFPEIEYVLTQGYKVDRNKLIELFNFLISQKNVKTSVFIKKAVKIFEQTNLDIADCIIIAHSQKGWLASFDKKMLGVTGVNAYWEK